MSPAPIAAVSDPDTLQRAPATELAPYALVRMAAVPYPTAPAGSATFRSALAELVQRSAEAGATAAGLSDALHDTATAHDPRFHRTVVLPLRRDIHNGRLPRTTTRSALGDLAERVPGLDEWLRAQDEIARLTGTVAAAAPAALAAEREALAGICRHDEVRRAVTLIGTDLLRGVDRVAASGAHPDSRARKAEPTVLRYALRASSKTSPLSWFTQVAWAGWAGPDTAERVDAGAPVAVTALNRTPLAAVTASVLGAAPRRDQLPHRLAPGLRLLDGRVVFRRDVPVPGSHRLAVQREEEVGLAHNRPLDLVVAAVRAAGPAGAAPADLAGTLAARLPGPAERTGPAALTYVRGLVEAGLLTPVAPFDPQRATAVRDFADWLDRHDATRLASGLRDLQADADTFPELTATDRPAALHRITQRWQVVCDEAGVPESPASPLTEDVGRRGRMLLGPTHGADAAATLPELGALVELFDQHLLVRRLLRDRFVAQFGIGGRCAELTEFTADLTDIWQAADLVGVDGRMAASGERQHLLTDELRGLAEGRAALTAAIRACAEPGAPEVRLHRRLLTEAAEAVPRWAYGRPASYSFFVQPAVTPSGPLLAVNHVYAGFGRFTSRFLDLVHPSAGAAVAAQLRRTFDPAARLAQFRPVNGFNANLHPLVAPDEVVEDPALGGIVADELELWHHAETDQIRLRHRGSGQFVDVLYLGFLVPFVMPDRFAPLYGDLGCGIVDLSHLTTAATVDGVAVRPRLRYRNVVLSRRSWTVPPDRVAGWRTELDADGEVPALATARGRARWGLPEHVFLSSDGATLRRPEDLFHYLDRPKPQYVDLGNALHLRCLSRLLGRHSSAVQISEAMPVPGVQSPTGRVVELVTETYRRAS
ncbi:lantibiotic biosynthesis dehydratase-like protein [Micromonospora pisi]|uniref:Lantibiotic biosynthesis dehydratase-like protein n=1 Tax=Micromonospora pisi TaxID=589240 RepID=A0A495JTX7_9ACTN|nr:lantibiotic dehydratase [Micromonospora pisi]RKR91995.1 lantibiotic biosynthesis dehydratase-like protein [Micromonospora pisi]